MTQPTKKLLAPIASWVVDQAIEKWPAAVVFFAVGGGAAYVASASAWLGEFGVVAWLGVGLTAVLICSAISVLYSHYLEKKGMADYFRTAAVTAATNVLAPVHSHERLKVADFYHPHFMTTADAKFEHCDLLGPANIHLDAGCTLTRCGFAQCDVVLVRPDRAIRGAVVFERCQFVDSRFYRLTLLMNVDHYKSLPPVLRDGLQVISDGRIGDV